MRSDVVSESEVFETITASWTRLVEEDDSAILGIAGATAVGKTQLSLALAEAFEAEIVSADSRQLYRHLDIGTAKPSAGERARVRHHFVDCLEPDQAYSAVQFAEDAAERIREIQRRGKRAIVVGGSTLYLDALLMGKPGAPSLSPHIRERLEVRLHEEGIGVLANEVRSHHASGDIDYANPHRVIRELASLLETGRSVSDFPRRLTPPFRCATYVLNRERSELYSRIEQRVDGMLTLGLLDEVAWLLARGFTLESAPGLRTIGYQEPIRHLSGVIDYDEMVRLMKRNTRRYAKRQLTFFRNQWERAQWVTLA
jgi:tRNA dimethylallyltransferase